MNKHLYILSIISIISKLRKSKSYKIVSWILKIVVAINLIITSGLFLTLTDFITPYNIIINIYSDLFEPYINISKNLYNDLTDKFNDSSVNKHLKSIENNSNSTNTNLSNINSITDKLTSINEYLIDDNDQIEIHFNFKTFSFYVGMGILYYFIFLSPGPSTPPSEIVKANIIDQGFYSIKVYIKDYINSYFNIGEVKEII